MYFKDLENKTSGALLLIKTLIGINKLKSYPVHYVLIKII